MEVTITTLHPPLTHYIVTLYQHCMMHLSLCPRSILLLIPSHFLLSLLFKVLLLSLGVKSFQLKIALQFLGFLSLDVSLFSLLLLVGLLESADGFLTRRTNFAKNLWTEVGILNQNIGDAEEVLEDWED